MKILKKELQDLYIDVCYENDEIIFDNSYTEDEALVLGAFEEDNVVHLVDNFEKKRKEREEADQMLIDLKINFLAS